LRQHLVPSIGDLETMVRLEDRLHRAERLVVEVVRNLAGAARPPRPPAVLPKTRPVSDVSAGSDADQLQRIVGRLQRAPDTESVLRVALEEIGALLGAQTAVVRLGTREQLVGVTSGDED